MSTHLEPLDDTLFAPLTPGQQDTLLGGGRTVWYHKTVKWVDGHKEKEVIREVD
jgi:hypothetical protein